MFINLSTDLYTTCKTATTCQITLEKLIQYIHLTIYTYRKQVTNIIETQIESHTEQAVWQWWWGEKKKTSFLTGGDLQQSQAQCSAVCPDKDRMGKMGETAEGQGKRRGKREGREQEETHNTFIYRVQVLKSKHRE